MLLCDFESKFATDAIVQFCSNLVGLLLTVIEMRPVYKNGKDLVFEDYMKLFLNS